MIDVDGSSGEGGGQILRTALALSSVLERDVRVHDIRAGRSEPGIKAQHLAGVRAVARFCGATVDGDKVGSTEIVYRPKHLIAGAVRIDVGSAGSTTLVLQTLMPLLAYCPGSSTVELVGGTDVRWSPPVDYLRLVTLPSLRRMGYTSDLKIVRRGHYPRGGGEVRLETRPVVYLKALVGVAVKRGRAARIEGVSHVVNLPSHVAERQAEAARNLITEKGLLSPDITIEHYQSPGMSPGSGLVLSAVTEDDTFVGADRLGEKGKPAEQVGREAAGELAWEVESGAFLDSHMADMVVPYMALADGVSEVSVSRITQHTLTNVVVAELLCGVEFDVSGRENEPGILRVKGLGVRSSPV